MRLNFAIDINIPSANGVAPPDKPVPEPRATTFVWLRAATRMTFCTSATVRGNTASKGIAR